MAGKEWIYHIVRADRRAGGDGYRGLRRRGKKPNGRGGRSAGRGHIPGRVRQDFPKGTDFRRVTQFQVRAVADRINRQPRKVLRVRTPQEVFTAAPP